MTSRSDASEFLDWRARQDTPVATLRDLDALESELTRIIREIDAKVDRLIGGTDG